MSFHHASQTKGPSTVQERGSLIIALPRRVTAPSRPVSRMAGCAWPRHTQSWPPPWCSHSPLRSIDDRTPLCADLGYLHYAEDVSQVGRLCWFTNPQEFPCRKVAATAEAVGNSSQWQLEELPWASSSVIKQQVGDCRTGSQFQTKCPHNR